MSDARGPEPWARLAYVLAGLGLLALVVLGSRPGGALPVVLYRVGLPVLGLLAALLLALGLATCALRRPALQRGRLPALLVAVGVLWGASFPLPYPSSHAGSSGAVALRLPFEGAAEVRWGGDRRAENVLVLDPARRFGVVFEPLEATTGERAVLSPAAGEVVRRSADGLVLRVAPDEFLVLAGFRPDPSAAGLEPGERSGAARATEQVAAGDRLGTAGGQPLTVHLQDGPEIDRAEGIPLRFRDVLADGRALRAGVPRRGQRVEQASEVPRIR